MFIIQNFLKSKYVIFSVEYIIPPLIINGVFNWIFPVLQVISVYYYIIDPLLHIYPTRTLWCVSFALFPPFHCQHTQMTLRVIVKYLYHFNFVLPTPLAPNNFHAFGEEMVFILLHLPMQML